VSSGYSRQDRVAVGSGPVNGSMPSTRRVGEPVNTAGGRVVAGVDPFPDDLDVGPAAEGLGEACLERGDVRAVG